MNCTQKKNFRSRAVALLVGLLFCSSMHCTSKENTRHVIFISLDTTRPDHLGCYGNPWIRTPNLDQLADESLLFSNYMTVVPTTLPSHTSLFTGTFPHRHGTPQNGFVVNSDNLMLTERLKSTGYHTAGFIGSFALDSRFHFSQGFDYYDETYEKFVGTERRTQNERSAQAVTDATIRYLEKKDVPSKLFLFVHYFDPHKPFDPPPPYNTLYHLEGGRKTASSILANYDCAHTLSNKDWETAKQAALNYAGEISYMDHHVGRLLYYLRQRGILDNALLVVTSDHGENFWEHMPYFHHGTATYQTTMHGICLIRLPKGNRGGDIIEQLTSSIDITPTVLHYLNLPVTEDIDGKVLDLSTSTGTLSNNTLYGQATLTRPWKAPEITTGWPHTNKARCIREGNYKYIQTPFAGTEELYDLSRDPFEQKNLLKSPEPEMSLLAEKLKAKLELWASSAFPLKSFLERKKQKETIEKLKALGYM
jgi:arylsulfatase A-like enzyme